MFSYDAANSQIVQFLQQTYVSGPGNTKQPGEPEVVFSVRMNIQPVSHAREQGIAGTGVQLTLQGSTPNRTVTIQNGYLANVMWQGIERQLLVAEAHKTSENQQVILVDRVGVK